MMFRILHVLFISGLSIFLASGCHMSTTRGDLNDSDASSENNTANGGDRSSESQDASKQSSDDSDDSNSNASDESKDEQGSQSSGTTGSNDNPSSDPKNGTSNGEGGIGGAAGGNDNAGTDSNASGGDTGGDDEPILEDEFQVMSCQDEECNSMFPFPDLICCTTGEAPYSDAKDRCGLNLSNFPMMPNLDNVARVCIQLDQPGEIDTACPVQAPFLPILPSPEVGCCMASGYCGGWTSDNFLFRLGCYANPDADAELVPCRLFETPEECRDAFAERGELTTFQGCVCDHCMNNLKRCRRNIGCVRIWECMLESGCRDVDDCYLNPNSPCKEHFEQHDAVSLSYALRISTCVRSNCE